MKYLVVWDENIDIIGVYEAASPESAVKLFMVDNEFDTGSHEILVFEMDDSTKYIAKAAEWTVRRATKA